MQASITIYRWVNAPWNKLMAQTPFIHHYDDQQQLEKYCESLAVPDDVRHVFAVDVGNDKLLMDLYKSEKKPVIIYPRSKYPR